jgi:CubicO group peptidase (beta-lactamase class C family)
MSPAANASHMDASGVRNPKFRELCERLVRDMKRVHVPGAAVGVSHRGREYAAGFGITSVEHPLPVTPDTLFQVGSISKTFTGTMLMQLAEHGRLDLDRPVRKYMKSLKLRDAGVAERVTTRHLLTHVGGWVGDYFNDFGNGDDALERMVREIATLKQVTPLGSIWSYNNTGFNIASRLIEILTAKPYEQAAADMLLDPLGLGMTFYFPSDILITHRFAAGHYRKDGKVQVARPWAIGRAGNGVGGVVSTVRDLLKYARFHMGNGNRIIKRRSLQAMRLPQVDAGGRGQMGITWFIRELDGLKVYSHGGATNGQQAGLYFIPAEDFALAILTNSDDGGILTAHALAWALEIFFDTKIKLPRPVASRPGELREYAGRYRIGTECFDLKVQADHLVYHHIPLGGFPRPDSPPGPAMPPMRIAFYEKDRVIGLDEPMKGTLGEFLRDQKGRVRFFRIGGRAHQLERAGSRRIK